MVLTWLTDEEAYIIPEDRCIPVQEIRGQVDHHRQFCELLQELTSLERKENGCLCVLHINYDNEAHSNGTMVAGSTGDEEKPPAAPDFNHVVNDSSQNNPVLFKVDPSPHGHHHRLRLFKDLLLHKWTVIAWKNQKGEIIHWKWLWGRESFWILQAFVPHKYTYHNDYN